MTITDLTTELPAAPEGLFWKVESYPRLDAPRGQLEIHVTLCKPGRFFGRRFSRTVAESWFLPELDSLPGEMSQPEIVQMLADQIVAGQPSRP